MLQHDNTKTYQVDDLFLFMPKNIKGSVYCRIIDTKNKENLILFEKVEEEKVYNVYKASLNNFIDTESGQHRVFFMVLKSDTYYSIDAGVINLAHDNFSAANRLFLMDKLDKEIKLACKKNEEYTKLNIELYEAIKEVVGLND